MTCRHCQARPANRRRGLCWSCYYKPGLRDLYPVQAVPANNRGHWTDDPAETPLPPPTEAPAGTPAKLAVLEARAAAGQELFHPEDNPRLP